MMRLAMAVGFVVAGIFVGCSGVAEAQHRDGKKILALGDSYTIGEGAESGDRWPNQLAAKLREAGIATANPELIARTGWTTANLLAALRHHRGDNYDLVTLMIGVNNQYQGRSTDEFRTQFAELLATAQAKAGGDARRVIVLSIPDWGATPFAAARNRDAIAAEIDAFNAIVETETARAGARFVDVTPLTRELAGDAAMLTRDRLHYSGAMMATWADLALPHAKAILAPPPTGNEDGPGNENNPGRAADTTTGNESGR